MPDSQDVLIIVPAFNESRSIQKLVLEIRAAHPSYRVLVINDGSADHTAAEAQKAGAKVVNLPYNLGIGGAIQSGFKVAHSENYDVAIQLDGDGQHDPKYLPNILEPVTAGKLDLCIGSRFLADRDGFQSTAARRMGIRFFSYLLRLLTGVSISDPTSGFRAYGRKAIRLFAEQYPVDFPEPEAVMIAKRHGLEIGEVPVKMRKRFGGISSIRYFKTVYYMLKVTLAILIDLFKKRG